MALDSTAIAFVGVGSSSIERRSERSIVALALDAAIEAIADAGLSRDDIDGYIGSPRAAHAGALHANGGDEIEARLFTERLGLRKPTFAIDLSGAFATDMATVAAYALQSKACNYVLGVRALYSLPGVKFGERKLPVAAGEQQFTAPFGYGAAGARFAIRLRKYFEASGATRRDLFDMVSLCRRNARENPVAVWRDRGLTLDEYMASPIVAEPLCRDDCDMPVCGAVAFVLTREELARQAPHPPVFLVGSANAANADRIFETARRTRESIDLCQLYDGFSFLPYLWLERLGWCAPGEAWKFVRDGGCERDGPLPLNTAGGSLGEGRMHGAGHLREGILQVRGGAGARQVRQADNCLVQIGPFDYSSLIVISREPR